MRRLLTLLIVSILVAPALAAPTAPAAPRRAAARPSAPPARPNPRTMQFKPLQFSPPRAERVVLGSGTVVYLLEDHELPVVNIYSLTRTGSVYEPRDKVGLAEMTGAVMRTGGTASRTPDQINAELEFMAAGISSGIGPQAGSTSLSALSKNFDQAYPIWVDILRNPAFDEEKVKLYRSQMIEGIRRQNDNPRDIARREFRRLIYPAHPFGASATVETVNRISRQDLVAFHRQYYHPNNLILGVSGDFDKRDMLARLEKTFQGWPRGELKLPPVPEIKPEWQGSVNFIYKDVPQSSIRIGHLGIKQANPDYYAVVVMNEILGGGGVFTNRLMKEIRSNRGLVYGVGSFFTTPSQELGMFGEAADTKSKTTVEVLQLMQDITRGLTAAPVATEELKLAKDSILNSFVFEFSSAGQIAWRQMNLEFDNLPADYLDKYPENIARVTMADVQRVARDYLHPDRMIVLVVGNDKNFDKPLSTFGKVNVIPLKEFTSKVE